MCGILVSRFLLRSAGRADSGVSPGSGRAALPGFACGAGAEPGSAGSVTAAGEGLGVHLERLRLPLDVDGSGEPGPGVPLLMLSTQADCGVRFEMPSDSNSKTEAARNGLGNFGLFRFGVRGSKIPLPPEAFREGPGPCEERAGLGPPLPPCRGVGGSFQGGG